MNVPFFMKKEELRRMVNFTAKKDRNASYKSVIKNNKLNKAKVK